MADRTGTDWFAWFVSAAFFGAIALLALRGMQATGAEAVLILVGTLGSAFNQIVSYRYGTTQNSEKKTDTITEMAKTATAVQAASTAAGTAAAAAPVIPDPVRVEVVGDVATTKAEP